MTTRRQRKDELAASTAGSAIEAAKLHFTKTGKRWIEVAEWREEGEETGRWFYAMPLSPDERTEINSLSTKEGKLDQGEAAARILIRKLKNPDGSPAFGKGDLHALQTKIDSTILGGIADIIVGEVTVKVSTPPAAISGLAEAAGN